MTQQACPHRVRRNLVIDKPALPVSVGGGDNMSRIVEPGRTWSFRWRARENPCSRLSKQDRLAGLLFFSVRFGRPIGLLSGPGLVQFTSSPNQDTLVRQRSTTRMERKTEAVSRASISVPDEQANVWFQPRLAENRFTNQEYLFE